MTVLAFLQPVESVTLFWSPESEGQEWILSPVTHLEDAFGSFWSCRDKDFMWKEQQEGEHVNSGTC